ncbi:protein translocase subunit SecY [Litorimonas cladophorae]|jgi:preprotein translocase subunit SecY|uniref:Protein translocase subunit SecY n=1 Tax=Litorimonas cladophorae TaxID=1220491 RepID=A0A918K9Y8_9PROT|nr:preprotein translocase subunit SecY [Litorimonas cladophorae]GGX55569.1 protein translocase subunit SecY [Litorimonas cladophorae]
MASASEQLAANMNLGVFSKAKELQKRLLFTLMILVVYRIGTFVPIPGMDMEAFQAAFGSGTSGGGLLDRFNMFSGGAVERMAIFALNVMPYISASIIMTLLKGSVASLKELDKDGEQGRKQINQYTRYLTVFLAAFQAFGIARALQGTEGAVINPGLFFQASTVITLVGGTMFLMWLGEQVTARGVGNGVSLIIFAGIVAELPKALFQLFGMNQSGEIGEALLAILIVMFIGLIMLIVYVERAQRRLRVQYPKRQMAGGKQFGGENSFMPLKLNTAGVIPPIFASSLLLLPATFGQIFVGGDGAASGIMGTVLAYLGYGSPTYLVLYGLLIIFFCYFYVPYVFKPDDVADNLRKNGGFLPGIRPGQRTAEYLSYVLSRLTFIGAIYVAFVCVLPEAFIARSGNIPVSVAMLIGGMSLLIIVSVTLDTVAQIQSHLIAHQYEGLIKKSRMRRRNKT